MPSFKILLASSLLILLATAPLTAQTSKPRSQPKGPTTQAKPKPPVTGPAKPQIPEAEARGKELLAAAILGAGGEERVGKLKAIGWHAVESRVNAQGQLYQRRVRGRVTLPDKMRLDVTQPDNSVVVFCFNGKQVWRQFRGKIDLLPNQLAAMRESLMLSSMPLLAASKELKVREVMTPEGFPGDLRCLLINRKKMSTVLFGLDPKTFQLKRRRHTVISPQAPYVRDEVLWDYRAVGGFRLPFARKLLKNGTKEAIIEVDSYKLNETYPATLFAVPKASGQ